MATAVAVTNKTSTKTKIAMTIPEDNDKDDPLKKLLGANFKSD